MSRTIRKDRNGKTFTEGRTAKVRYGCRCSYCTGVARKALVEKLTTEDLKKQLKEIDV